MSSPEEEKKQKNTFVFETPFEINETQVQFVPNKAEFLDKVKAKTALKPVAEASLAAPEHSVMSADTTATDGPQNTAVTRSEQRAQAAKQNRRVVILDAEDPIAQELLKK